MSRMQWQKWKEKYWPPGKEQLLVLILTGLLFVVIAIPADRKSEQTKDVQERSASETQETYEEQLEQKFAEVLSRVEGAGNVQVMLTFKDTGRKEVEKDREVSADSRKEETVYEEAGGQKKSPYVSSEKNPQVEGVLVIAEGGDKSKVKEEFIGAAQALFGIEPHKIKIIKMEVEKDR